jgi:pilus assembly protein Flp/PilA
MIKLVRNLVRDDSGAAAAEYALILAIVGAAIGGAAFLLGNQVKTSITGAAQQVKDCSATATTGCVQPTLT